MAPTILLGQIHGHPQGATTRNDGDLIDRIVIRHHAANDGVSSLMVGCHLFFALGHHHGLALGAHHDLVLRPLELVHAHQAFVKTGSKQSGFIDQVRQIGPRESRRPPGDDGCIHIFPQGHLAHVHLEDLLAATNIGQTNHDLTVETTRSQQGRIQNIRTVGGRNDDDRLMSFKTIHLDQHLVQGLLTLVVTAAQTGTPLAPYRIDFVDEDDARGRLLGLLEHIPHPRCPHPDEHFDEIRTGDGEKRHLGFTGNRLGQQRLTSPRLADHQDALGDLAAQFLETGWILKVIDQLFDIFLGFITASDVGKGSFDLIFTHQTGTALTERHGALTATALHLAHEEDPNADQQQHREPGDEDGAQQTRLFRHLADHLDVVLDQTVEQIVIIERHDGAELVTVAFHTIDYLAINANFPDLLLRQFGDERGVIHLSPRAIAGAEALEQRHQHHGDDQPKNQVFRHITQIVNLAM